MVKSPSVMSPTGVHTDTWLHPELAALFDRYLDFGWRMAIDDPSTWTGVARIPDAELWQQHTHVCRQMLELIRKRTACFTYPNRRRAS